MYPNFVPTQYRRPLNIVLLLALVVVLYLIGKKLKLWDKAKAEGAEIQIDPSKPAPKVGFNAVNECVKIADLLSQSWDGEGQDEQAFDIILAYKDNELILVHNEWRKKYAGGNYWGGVSPTIRQQVNAETLWFYRTSAIQKKKKVIAKLDRLNL